jgi:hypothetical protein
MYMKLHPDDFAPFLDEALGFDEYIKSVVLSADADAEHLTIMALTAVVKIPVTIQYLDLSPGPINAHTFPESASAQAGQSKGHVNLLYRPSHYEILYRQPTVSGR